MSTKTQEEWDLMSAQERKDHLIAEEKIVFGHDFKKIKGKPVEMGIGSPGHETDNHFRSIAKYEGVEAEKAARAAAALRKKKAD